MIRAAGYVYILHFRSPLGNDRHQARHYVGWTRRWYWRMLEHRAGRGAKIMAACADRAIAFDVATVAAVVTIGRASYTGRAAERAIKRSHHIARFCPLCGGRGAADYRSSAQCAAAAEVSIHVDI